MVLQQKIKDLEEGNHRNSSIVMILDNEELGEDANNKKDSIHAATFSVKNTS